jgi:hypothetical protein
MDRRRDVQDEKGVERLGLKSGWAHHAAHGGTRGTVLDN